MSDKENFDFSNFLNESYKNNSNEKEIKKQTNDKKQNINTVNQETNKEQKFNNQKDKSVNQNKEQENKIDSFLNGYISGTISPSKPNANSKKEISKEEKILETNPKETSKNETDSTTNTQEYKNNQDIKDINSNAKKLITDKTDDKIIEEEKNININISEEKTKKEQSKEVNNIAPPDDNSFPYDPNKKFNKQQAPVFFPGKPLIEMLEEKYRLLAEEQQYKMENLDEFDILNETKNSKEMVDELNKILGNEETEKKKSKISKFQKPVSKEKLVKLGYPKMYFDPTDAEFDPKTNKYNYFYNVEKTLRKNNLLWIRKIIPMHKLEKMTYDNSFLDAYADKQHTLALRLNSMTAEEQYRYELRKKTKRILFGFIFALSITIYFLFSKVPNNNYQGAIKLFEQKKWELSMKEFKDIGNYKDSTTYYIYARAKLKEDEKKFDEAIKDFESIKNKSQNIGINIEDEINEAIYLKGVHLYTNNNYEEAVKTFRKIKKYKESKEYINKSQYAIAENHYDKGEYKEALDIFYSLGRFSDSENRAKEIAEELYESASKKYKNNEYKKASELFKLLSRYEYRNSRNMVDQIVYKIGLDNYLDGNYVDARESFMSIKKYKDSDAMIKETTYNLAKKKYGDSISDSLEEFLKIRDYKDVPLFLNKGVFTLFGEWKIVEMNGTKSDEAIFRFTDKGLIESEEDILYAAISTEDNEISYEWDGKEYSALGGKYKISTERINGQTIKVKFKEGNNSVIFTCLEQKDYLTMMNKNTDTTIEEQKEIDKLVKLMQNYINKKTDGETIKDNSHEEESDSDEIGSEKDN